MAWPHSAKPGWTHTCSDSIQQASVVTCLEDTGVIADRNRFKQNVATPGNRKDWCAWRKDFGVSTMTEESSIQF